jgi:membrane protein involved in colicin uptake
MTQPNPNAEAEADAKAKADADAAKAKAKAGGKVKRGDVVHFTAVDAHTGDKFTGLGVVTLAQGGTVTVRPLAEHDVQVLDAEPIVVDEG